MLYLDVMTPRGEEALEALREVLASPVAVAVDQAMLLAGSTYTLGMAQILVALLDGEQART